MIRNSWTLRCAESLAARPPALAPGTNIGLDGVGVTVDTMTRRADTPTQPSLVTPVFLLVTVSTFFYFLSIGSIVPTLPRFVEGPLGGSSLSVGLAVGSFAFSAVLLRPFVGGLGDRKGRRLLIIGGALLVGLSILGYVWVESLVPLLILRLVMGVGEAAFYVGAASAINDLAADERRGEAMSIFSLALYAGIALGTVVGESVLEVTDFNTVWLAAGGFAGIAAFLGIRVADTRPAYEERAKTRFIHPAGLKPGTILASSVWGLAGFNTFVPLYALSIGMSGSRAVFFTFSAIVLGIRFFGKRLPDILGPRKASRIALTTNAAGLILMGVWAEPIGLFLGATLFGVGQALTFPALITIALSGTPASERGAVVGTFTAFFDLAFGLGALSLGAIAGLVGYRGLFISAGLVSVAGLGLLQTYAHRSDIKAKIEEALLPERV